MYLKKLNDNLDPQIMMALEKVGEREKPVNALEAYQSWVSLITGDPAATLETVRRSFQAAARYEVSQGRRPTSARYPFDSALCIVAGIDPQTGEEIKDKEQALRRYEEIDQYSFIASIRQEYNWLMRQPVIQRELAKEAPNVISSGK